ncbi:MAG: DUF1015 domain-containing protein [Candidatus Acidiferrales bacterium]
MASIYPFRALRYRPEKAGAPLADLVTQPYDKITPAMQERYYQLSPHNLITLEKGKSQPGDNGENVYTRAAAWLERTIAAGALAPETEPAIYPYFQEYTLPGTNERRVRKGFIALGRIEDYSAEVVFRHELTLSGPKRDRLELLRHTRAHTGQLFMIFSDPAGQVDRLLDQIARSQTPQEITDEYGDVHRLWAVTDAATVRRFQELLAEKKLIIADGHHRYETALAYRDDCRARAGRADPDAPHEKVMMTFVNMDQPGVTILPTHRVVANLPGFDFNAFREKASALFDWYAYPRNASGKGGLIRLLRDLSGRGAERPSFGLCAAGEPALYLFLLKVNVDLAKELPQVGARQRQLDLVVLHRLLLDRCLGLSEESVRQEKNLHYLRGTEEAMALVDRGEAPVAFLVNPVRIQQVRDIALAGETLPQKSTDFYPKMLSGITIYHLDHT